MNLLHIDISVEHSVGTANDTRFSTFHISMGNTTPDLYDVGVINNTMVCEKNR